MTGPPTAVDTTSLETGFDNRAVARRIIAEGRKLKKTVPTLLDLMTAITSIQVEDTIQGSSSLTITLNDPGQVILLSGLVDPNVDGKLDRIELNYPDGSDYWWSLNMISVTDHNTLQLVFMERAAVWLMQFRGPLKASRASMTRAEFIQMLVTKTKMGIDFHSQDLKVEEPIEITPPTDPGKTVKGKKTTAQKTKTPGIAFQLQPVLTNWDGGVHTLTKQEVANADLAMSTAIGITANARAIKALMEACIVEAPFFANPNSGDSSSVGILQLLDTHLNGSTSTTGGRRDIALCCKLFLESGFANGSGAIAAANANPSWTPGQIAQWCQGSGHPDRYDKVSLAADTVIQSYGAGSLLPGGTAAKTKSNYNFQVGNSSNPRETYWDAIQRLATEVKWDFFVDGNDVYFDPETTLIRQRPDAVLNAFDPAVVDWHYDWDARHIATEMTITVVCDPNDFRAGTVVQLDKSFGPAGVGSNISLPGRWLVETTSRDLSNWTTELTLKQPTFPGPEPATQTVDLPDQGIGDKTTTGKVYAESAKIDGRNLPYIRGGGHGMSWTEAEQATGLDCSSSVSLALHAGGLMGGVGGPQVSEWFVTWGDGGQGKNMTVWVKPGSGSDAHVWIEFHGRKATRFDTSPWGSGGSGPHLRYTTRNGGHPEDAGFIPRRFTGDV